MPQVWGNNVVQALHNGKASHDAMSIGHLKLPHSNIGQRQRRVDATGMLKRVSRCVREGLPCLQRTLTGVSAIHVRGYPLCSSTNVGCGKPQMTDEQKVDTHVFLLCVNKTERLKFNNKP